MKTNSVILSTLFLVTILFSTAQMQAIALNRKHVALVGAAVILGLVAIRYLKNCKINEVKEENKGFSLSKKQIQFYCKTCGTPFMASESLLQFSTIDCANCLFKSDMLVTKLN